MWYWFFQRGSKVVKTDIVWYWRTPSCYSDREASWCGKTFARYGLVSEFTFQRWHLPPPTGLESAFTSSGYWAAAAAISSSGMLWLIISVLFAFRKAVAACHAACLCLSCFAMLPPWGPHCPPSNATNLPLWLLHQATRAAGLRYLLVPETITFSHSLRHVAFA